MPPLPNRIWDEIDAVIVQAMNEHVLPGLGAVIVQDGKPIYVRCLGLASIARDATVTGDTVFRIGSITKTFTAIALMQLWERRKFDLDAPVNDYLTTFRIDGPEPGAPPVTFRYLLTHTSGIGMVRNWTDFLRPMAGLAVGAEDPVLPLGAYYSGRLEAEVTPGTKWAYSNHAFATLGQLIEDLSGQPYPEYLRQHLFQPLGMSQTDVVLSERVRDQLAQGYRFACGRLRPVEYQEVALRAAGSAFSTPADLGRYATTLLGRGRNEYGAILKAETLELMLRPHFQLHPRLPAMGLAFILEEIEGRRIAWHNGGWPGFSSALFIAPDDHLGIVLLTNTLSEDLDGVARRLLGKLLVGKHPLISQRPPILETPALWPDVAGFYAPRRGFATNLAIWHRFGGEVQVVVQRNHLALRSVRGPLGPTIPLQRADRADPLVFQLAGERGKQAVVFHRHSRGGIDAMYLGFYQLDRRRAIQSLRAKLIAGLGVLAVLAAAIGGWCWRRTRS